MATKTRNKWGLPPHVDPAKLVPDPNRNDVWILPHLSGDSSKDEVFTLHSDFANERSDDEIEDAIQAHIALKQDNAEVRAKMLVDAAKEQADAIIANARAEAAALKSGGLAAAQAAGIAPRPKEEKPPEGVTDNLKGDPKTYAVRAHTPDHPTGDDEEDVEDELEAEQAEKERAQRQEVLATTVAGTPGAPRPAARPAARPPRP